MTNNSHVHHNINFRKMTHLCAIFSLFCIQHCNLLILQRLSHCSSLSHNSTKIVCKAVFNLQVEIRIFFQLEFLTFLSKISLTPLLLSTNQKTLSYFRRKSHSPFIALMTAFFLFGLVCCSQEILPFSSRLTFLILSCTI